MNFASDNIAGIAPAILDRIARANTGISPGYGRDDLTATVERRFAELFEHDVATFMTATGTAANALALAQIAPPWTALLCHREAHVAVDECGAPEFFGGGLKLIGLPGVGGKLAPETVASAIERLGEGWPHVTRPSALSLTQATEAGTIYTLAELRTLADIAHGHGLYVHMDGARFANALIALDATPAQMSWQAGIDILSFGATKNGAMAAEAIVAFDPAAAATLHERRKRGGHLLSKYRFLSAQFDAYLAQSYWLDLAGHANAMAALLARRLEMAGLAPVWPVEANLVFVILPAALDAKLRAAGADYYARASDSLPTGVSLRPGDILARFVTSFATEAAEIDAFMAALTAPGAP